MRSREPARPLRGLVLPHRRLILQSLVAAAATAWLRPAFADDEDPSAPPPPDAMTPVHERYAALKSYSDTGTVEVHYQWPGTPETVSHYRFETAFRAPRNFFFRFDAEKDTSGDVFVIWCDGGDFQSWWKATGVHEVYGGGRGADGFFAGGSPTKDAVNLLAAHIFSSAVPYGPTAALTDVKEAGEEDVNGHACRKLVASGRQTGVVTSDTRPVTVWVDKELTLVRKVRIDAEAGSQAEMIDTILYEIEPVADPELADDRFTFNPPT